MISELEYSADNRQMKADKHLKIIFLILLIVMISTSFTSAQTIETGSPPDTIKDFEVLRARVRANIRDVPAINSLGIIYARANRLDEAIRLWQYALKIDPEYVHLYNNLGSALKNQGKKEEARLIFKMGLRRAPSGWIHYNLGILEEENNNLVEAANHFKKCLKLQPEFEPAIRKLTSLGYHSELPLMTNAQPVTLGSYKPPVETKNINFYPTSSDKLQIPPDNSYQVKSLMTSKPFKALSYNDCDNIIKSFKAEPAERYIALTFDDGPHHTHTLKILEILKKEEAKATFFVVGNRAETYPEIISRISSEGHDIGNHTWNHKALTKSPITEGIKSIQKTNDFLSRITGKQCRIIRPPFGYTNKSVKNMLKSHGWHEIMWDSDSRDWENKNPDRILHRVMKSVKPKGITLFHDIHAGAAKMLPTLIKVFKANGYRFVTISELIKLTNTEVAVKIVDIKN